MLRVIFFLVTCSLFAQNITSRVFEKIDQGWNSDELAKMYFHHSEIQRQWAWEALSRNPLRGEEKILDFGSGDGKISAEMARMCRNGYVVGVDVSEKMVHLAQILFPRYAFPNLEFRHSRSLTFADWAGREEYDIVCAFTVFHLVANPLETLKNLKMPLKPQGKLLLIIPTGKNPTLYEAANEVFAKYGMVPPWKGCSQSDTQSMRTMEGSAALLAQAGYQIKSQEIVDTDNAFYDLEDLASWLIGTSSATWQIPPSIAIPFYRDLVEKMIQFNPSMIDSEGRVRFQMPRLHITAIN